MTMAKRVSAFTWGIMGLSIVSHTPGSHTVRCKPLSIHCILFSETLSTRYDHRMAATLARTSAARLQWIASLWAGFALFDSVQTVFSMRAEGMPHTWITLFFTGFFS